MLEIAMTGTSISLHNEQLHTLRSVVNIVSH
jgi:hypothetical protein